MALNKAQRLLLPHSVQHCREAKVSEGLRNYRDFRDLLTIARLLLSGEVGQGRLK